jgi:hypothetical protein
VIEVAADTLRIVLSGVLPHLTTPASLKAV